jgi:hypothetical protein
LFTGDNLLESNLGITLRNPFRRRHPGPFGERALHRQVNKFNNGSLITQKVAAAMIEKDRKIFIARKHPKDILDNRPGFGVT